MRNSMANKTFISKPFFYVLLMFLIIFSGGASAAGVAASDIQLRKIIEDIKVFKKATQQLETITSANQLGIFYSKVHDLKENFDSHLEKGNGPEAFYRDNKIPKNFYLVPYPPFGAMAPSTHAYAIFWVGLGKKGCSKVVKLISPNASYYYINPGDTIQIDKTPRGECKSGSDNVIAYIDSYK